MVDRPRDPSACAVGQFRHHRRFPPPASIRREAAERLRSDNGRLAIRELEDGDRCGNHRADRQVALQRLERGTCSYAIARAVIRFAVAEGYASVAILDDVEETVRRAMRVPEYRPMRFEPADRLWPLDAIPALSVTSTAVSP
jgi:hypothetical protein